MKSIIYHSVSGAESGVDTHIAAEGQCDCDCDCACASVSAVSFSDIPFSASWHKTDGIYSTVLSPEYAALVSPRKDGVVVLNSGAQKILSSFTSPLSMDHAGSRGDADFSQTARRLAALGFLMPAEDDCACPSSKGICGSAETVTLPLLVAWLHLTDRCNLRCSYCYLPHVHEDMSLETGRAAIDAVFRSAGTNHFKRVKLKYAGGEPLLRFPLLVELHRYAESLADQYGIGLEGVVLSNGTLLTAEIVKKLKSLDLRLMISLDGLDHYHDTHRSYAGGRGSFKDVAEAVGLALEHGLVPNISVTVSSRTTDGLAEVVAWILEREVPFGLNFYRENEISASQLDMRLDEEKIINGMLAAFKVIENNLPRRSFLGGLIDRANLSTAHMHTCGVGQNYLVFDQNGQIAKCQMHIHKPITNARVQDPLAVIRTDQTGIQNLSVEEKEGCKDCPWRHWCAGGCPLETYRATGRYDVNSPNCNIYKALFPEALRLDGFRLLKYQNDPQVVTRY